MTTNEAPYETINGYPILAQYRTTKSPMTRAGRVIVVERAGEHPCYVVAWQGWDGEQWDGEWHKGDYIGDLMSALDRFHEVAYRYARDND